MKTYIAKIKEVGNPTVLSSSIITCDGMTVEELVKFWGLDEEDVEWYRLYQLICGELVEL